MAGGGAMAACQRGLGARRGKELSALLSVPPAYRRTGMPHTITVQYTAERVAVIVSFHSHARRD